MCSVVVITVGLDQPQEVRRNPLLGIGRIQEEYGLRCTSQGIYEGSWVRSSLNPCVRMLRDYAVYRVPFLQDFLPFRHSPPRMIRLGCVILDRLTGQYSFVLIVLYQGKLPTDF